MLKSTAKSKLDKVASVIKSQYPGQVIRVEGYTDSDPIKKSGWKTNERLSGERAMAVEEYLTSRGLSKDQIYYAGFGAAQGRKQEGQPSRRDRDPRGKELSRLGNPNQEPTGGRRCSRRPSSFLEGGCADYWTAVTLTDPARRSGRDFRRTDWCSLAHGVRVWAAGASGWRPFIAAAPIGRWSTRSNKTTSASARSSRARSARTCASSSPAAS